AHLPTRRPRPAPPYGIASICPQWIRPIRAPRRKELPARSTNRHGCNQHGRASATSRRRSAHKELETVGTVLVGTAVGDGPRRLFALRQLLGLFSARPRTQPRLSLGGRRTSGYHGSAMPSLFRTRALERKRSDFEGAALRINRRGR